MDIYSSIASWSGWPPIVALLLVIGAFGTFFFQKHIDILKEEIELLERELRECRNFAPDVLAQRLAERHKLLQNELEALAQDKERDAQRSAELEQELLKTREEAQNIRRQLDSVQEILADMDLPRDGKIKPHIAEDILETVFDQSCIYIPVRLGREPKEETSDHIKNRKPFKIEVIFPGMFQMYLGVYDNENYPVGYVESPYREIYNKDYFVTLLEILKHVPNENLAQGVDIESTGSTLLLTSEFHDRSPIDPNIVYIKIPFDENILNEVLANSALTRPDFARAI